MTKRFIKVTEDFVCEKCGKHVEGDGYTNHCPECLWSKHVDNNPGDRACGCQGLMLPSLESVKGDKYTLKHACQTCGHTKLNKASENDSKKAIIDLSHSD
jgi:rubrerythrin